MGDWKGCWAIHSSRQSPTTTEVQTYFSSENLTNVGQQRNFSFIAGASHNSSTDTANIITDLPIRDTQSGFRAYSKKAIDLIEFSNDGFTADSEILISASENGLRISEEKITVIYDTGHKTSTKNPVSHAGGVLGSLIELISLKVAIFGFGGMFVEIFFIQP